MTDDFLFTIAEIAVALIGFSGVVAVLGHRGKGSWQPAERVRLLALTEPSIIALTGALLPATLQLALLGDEIVWRVSNLIVLLLHLLSFGAYIRRSRNTKTRLSQKLMASLAVVVFLGLASSALNIIQYHEFTFTLGLLLGIAVAVFNFSLLLFHVHSDEVDAA